MCARALIKQGFHVNIFDEMKDKGPGSIRNLEEILEYIPMMCDNYKEHPIWKLLNEGKAHYGAVSLDVDVCDVDQKFFNDDSLDQAEKKFFEIINEILNTGKIK
jgi:hypothetical protein